jgi:hypothetical protein
MFNKDNKFNTLVLSGKKDVFPMNNDGENYNYGTLTCLGGGSFHKGLSIGMQDKMVSGLLIYDDENFYGYSEKNGLMILSNNLDFKELEMPVFDSSLEKQEKILNIDLTFRDITNYYISIPKEIEQFDIQLIFNITFIYDEESAVNNLNFYIMNDYKKDVKINIKNNNIYYSGVKLKKNNESIIKLNITFINNEHITCFIDRLLKN